jgi:nitrogen fixation protein NifU and related proteins
MVYNDLVKRHFFQPKNLFSGKEEPMDVITIRLGTVALGDAITLYFKCDPKTLLIETLQFKVYGNPYLIAAMSYWSEQLTSQPLHVAEAMSAPNLIADLALPQTKHYCAYMVEDALQQAITNWRETYV